MSAQRKRPASDANGSRLPKKPKSELPASMKREKTEPGMDAETQAVSELNHLEDRAVTITREKNPRTNRTQVVYWMGRDQRVDDNWALVYAQRMAQGLDAHIAVCFLLDPDDPRGSLRRYKFMFEGLAAVELRLHQLGIPFYLFRGSIPDATQQLLLKFPDLAAVIADFSPLRSFLSRQAHVASVLDEQRIPLIRVDAHNCVPIWQVSEKQEYAARTIRPKIHRLLNDYLEMFPPITPQLKRTDLPSPIDWTEVESTMNIDRTVPAAPGYVGGEEPARAALQKFLGATLKHFADQRNDPVKQVCSGLSPYLNFGHISAARCVLESNKLARQYSKAVQCYIEELVVRRELSDNFCFYNGKYDTVDCATDWARTTLKVHEEDPRPTLHTLGELEYGCTYDDLWNASQLQLIREGKMHGFLRMYWAKKILEWSKSPAEALATALYLNDKYELDGRDPNGFVGCAWSIAGIHDTAWTERPIFGKIRFMNYAGCKRKFSIPDFVKRYDGATPGSAKFRQNQKLATETDIRLKSPPKNLL